jgi:carbon monoxide dehydrogenase subunit G
MASYRAELHTTLSPEQAFAYLSEFSNVREWDPGVVDARPEGEGRHRVTISMFGRRSDLLYRTLEHVPNRRVVLEADSGRLVSHDEIEFEPRNGATRIVYRARVELRGPLALLDPLLALGFRRAGDRALAGLRRRLAELEAAAPAPRSASVPPAA